MQKYDLFNNDCRFIKLCGWKKKWKIYIRGMEVLTANHLMYVGVTNNSDKFVEIKSLCLQTSDLSGHPHKLTFF